jgi:dTDP-4-amino-4,6-dideoxygalactose transaminase
LKAQYARLKDTIDARVAAVFAHGQFILGPEVGELEDALAAFTGARYAVGVASGTDALLIALMAEGVGPGDAVFIPSFTFTATAEVVVLLGATPVFVDVDEHSFNIDVADLERQVGLVNRSGILAPKAVIAVDLFGLPADYVTINQLAMSHGMFVLADAAQSFGARYGNARVGTLAPATATSFFPAKPLGCYGDGGALLTDDDALAALYRSIRTHGSGVAKYDISRIGLNSRLDTLQAAILLAKLEVFEDELNARQRVAALYDKYLGDLAKTPIRVEGSKSAWAQYSILVKDRDAVAKALTARGVANAVYYPRPMHLQPAYAEFGLGPGSLAVSEKLCERVLSLPIHPYLSDEDIRRVADGVRLACPDTGTGDG